MINCCVSGCKKNAVGYGRMCETHKSRKRRHGAPDQLTIRKADLRPYITEVESWFARDPDNSTWGIASERWSGFVAQVGAVERTTMHGPTRRAATEVQRLGQTIDPQRVIVTVFALCLMREYQPNTFKNEEALRLAAVRRVRSLCQASMGLWQKSSEERTKSALREIPPRVNSIIGRWLMQVLGGAGIYLADRHRRTEEGERTQKRNFEQALATVRVD